MLGNILYYPGCLTKFVLNDIKENYKEILKKIGVKFITLENYELCCGSPLKSNGYFEDFENIAKKNFEIFRRFNIKKIIANCPACYYTFKFEYPKIVPNWKIEVKHVTEIILEALKKGKLKVKKVNEKITYHDPCHLARYARITEEPREILRFLGFEIVEMEYCKEKTFCCGGGGGLRANHPEISERVARMRIEQAKKTGAKFLVTTCPMCYVNLKDKVFEVYELSQILKKLLL